MMNRTELIERCMAASYDERLSDGMLYRKAAIALESLTRERDEWEQAATYNAKRAVVAEGERQQLREALEQINALDSSMAGDAWAIARAALSPKDALPTLSIHDD